MLVSRRERLRWFITGHHVFLSVKAFQDQDLITKKHQSALIRLKILTGVLKTVRRLFLSYRGTSPIRKHPSP